MPIFDRYIAVDWSANNGPKTGKDSIWIGEATPAGLVASRNPATRASAMADIETTLLSARSRGERIMVGFDFAFAYPKGAAADISQTTSPSSPLRQGHGASITSPLPASPTGGEVLAGGLGEIEPYARSTPPPFVGEAGRGAPLAPTSQSGLPPPRGEGTGVGGALRSDGWKALWSTLHTHIVDSDANISNRFDVAAQLNRATAPRFWGHPHGRTYSGLAPTRPAEYATIAERRGVEARIRGPQPVWKLTGVGAVGSQSLLGIPRLEALRRHPVLGPDIAVWPFETDFERALVAPITLVEIYPSLFQLTVAVDPKDRAQVETCVRHYAELDAAGLLATFLSAPADLPPDLRADAVAEEGWIAGVGHDALWQSLQVAA